MSMDKANIEIMDAKHKSGVKMNDLLLKVGEKNAFIFVSFQVWEDTRDTYISRIYRFEALEDTTLGSEVFEKGDKVYAELDGETPLYNKDLLEDVEYGIIEPSDIEWYSNFDDEHDEIINGDSWRKL